MNKPKEIIGRTIIVDLPRLNLSGISAKTDTGAYYCALHCCHIETRSDGLNEALYFTPFDPGHPLYKNELFSSQKFIQKVIKNSFGATETRYAIRTSIRIHGRSIKTWLTLTNRGSMKFPMLIGRKILKNKFMIDPSLNEIRPPPIS